MTSSRTGPWRYFWVGRWAKLGEAPGYSVPAGLPFRHDLGKAPRAERVSYDDHEVETGGQFLPQLAKRLAHHAFGSISLDGVAHATRGGNPQAPSLPHGRTPEEEDEAWRYYPVPGLLNAAKLGALSNPVTSREPTSWPGQGPGAQRHGTTSGRWRSQRAASGRDGDGS